MPYQISLQCDEIVELSQLQFSSLEINFSDDRPSCTVHAANDGSMETIVDLGPVHDEPISKSTGALVWKSGQRIVVHGSVQSEQEMEIKVCSPPKVR